MNIYDQYRNWKIDFDEQTEEWTASNLNGDGKLSDKSLSVLKAKIDRVVTELPDILVTKWGRLCRAKLIESLNDGTARILYPNEDNATISEYYYPPTNENLRILSEVTALYEQVDGMHKKADEKIEMLSKPY